MGARFIGWFIIAFSAAALALGGVGYAVSTLWVTPPRELYRNPAFEFELAAGWWCAQDGTEDTCFPSGTKPLPAIGVIAIKLRNSADNLAAYEKHLQTPQHLKRDSETSPLSKVQYARRIELGGREWVEALHTESELKDFNTYYMATATSHLGVLVTLSMRKDKEAQFIGEFKRMMQSLKTYQR